MSTVWNFKDPGSNPNRNICFLIYLPSKLRQYCEREGNNPKEAVVWLIFIKINVVESFSRQLLQKTAFAKAYTSVSHT